MGCALGLSHLLRLGADGLASEQHWPGLGGWVRAQQGSVCATKRPAVSCALRACLHRSIPVGCSVLPVGCSVLPVAPSSPSQLMWWLQR